MQDAAPGGLNNAINSRSSTTTISDQTNDYVAWNGELRLRAGCQVTRSLRLDVLWRWIATGPTYSAPDSFVYTLPKFGYRQSDGRTAHGDSLIFAVTYVH